jgi:hypothetical protein
MKKLYKTILLVIPALAVALAVGATTIGCGDTTTTPDMPVTTPADMTTGKDGK